MGTNPYQGQNADQSNQYGGYPAQPGFGQQGRRQSDDQYVYGQQGQQQYGQQQQQQQQGAYQPPLSASAQGNTGAFEPTSTGMDAKNEAVLSYALWWVSGLIFFIIERKNRTIRFHAAQSFIFLGSVSLVYILFRLITIIPFIGFLLNPIVSCLTLALLIPAALIWVFLMVQSYRGVKIKLPIVGDYAEALVVRFTKKSRPAKGRTP